VFKIKANINNSGIKTIEPSVDPLEEKGIKNCEENNGNSHLGKELAKIQFKDLKKLFMKENIPT
jgi:hypothetical protein